MQVVCVCVCVCVCMQYPDDSRAIIINFDKFRPILATTFLLSKRLSHVYFRSSDSIGIVSHCYVTRGALLIYATRNTSRLAAIILGAELQYSYLYPREQ